jgi:predicted metal-dependent HD superfamily phosphohydrolase
MTSVQRPAHPNIVADDWLPGMRWRHYKGGTYTLAGRGRVESDLSEVVVYRADRDPTGLWVRPLTVFCEPVVTGAGTQARFAPDWPDCLRCLDFLPRATVLAVLALYDAPYRHYHDRSHVMEMFELAHARGVSLMPAQALAVLFHDAVYVPGSPHNEAASAALIATMAAGVAPDLVQAAARIVLDTGTHTPVAPDGGPVLDLDLYRLASPAEQFERYSDDVFAENAGVLAAHTGLQGPALRAAFDARRAAFMAQLAARPRLFHTDAFADCEAPARANLARIAAKR